MKELYEDLKNQYDRAISDNEKYCGELSNQIKAILRKSDLKNGAYTVEQRVKSWDSIFNNLTADRGSYRSMRDVSDLVGVRVVFLFKKDVENFCVDLREKFEIVKEEDKKSFLSADQFGYSSIHFLIKPPQSWREVPSFESFCDLTAEIQVRTAAQHIWANVSHLLNYKQKTQIPEPVLRVLNRSSALLEVIDNEFSLLLEKKDEYLISIKKISDNPPLNIETLKSIIGELLPKANEGEDENYSDVLDDLLHFGVADRKELENIYEKHKDKILKEDREKAQALASWAGGGKNVLPSTRIRAEKGVFSTCVGLLRTVLYAEYGQPVMDYITRKMAQR